MRVRMRSKSHQPTSVGFSYSNCMRHATMIRREDGRCAMWVKLPPDRARCWSRSITFAPCSDPLTGPSTKSSAFLSSNRLKEDVRLLAGSPHLSHPTIVRAVTTPAVPINSHGLVSGVLPPRGVLPPLIWSSGNWSWSITQHTRLKLKRNWGSMNSSASVLWEQYVW